MSLYSVGCGVVQNKKVKEESRSTKKPVADLLLDDKNPRLQLSMEDTDQKALLKQFDKAYNLLPLAKSIVENGYYQEEPLYVIPEHDGKFVVIEGNRRLAAERFLTEPEARRLSIHKAKWDQLAGQVKSDLSSLPVIIYPKRDDLDDILAFKHISGVLKWQPIQKARFINDLVERKNFKVTFQSLSDDTGSSKTTICNYYVSYRAYLQLKDNDVDVSKLESTYSLFYTALGNSKIKAFIGIDTLRKNLKQLENPIPEDKICNASEIMEYVHGTADKNPVIVDSRQIMKLGEIISDKKALEALRNSKDFSYAQTFLESEEHALLDNLRLASKYLDDALGDVHRHNQNTTVCQWVDRCTGTFLRIIEMFPAQLDKVREKVAKPT